MKPDASGSMKSLVFAHGSDGLEPCAHTYPATFRWLPHSLTPWSHESNGIPVAGCFTVPDEQVEGLTQTVPLMSLDPWCSSNDEAMTLSPQV